VASILKNINCVEKMFLIILAVMTIPPKVAKINLILILKQSAILKTNKNRPLEKP